MRLFRVSGRLTNAVKPDFTAPVLRCVGLDNIPMNGGGIDLTVPRGEMDGFGPLFIENCVERRSRQIWIKAVYLHPQVRAAEYSLRGTGDARCCRQRQRRDHLLVQTAGLEIVRLKRCGTHARQLRHCRIGIAQHAPLCPWNAHPKVQYNVPSEMQGTVFHGIRLVLRDGRIVEASSSDTRRMNDILDTDPNARRIGEFAMGFNPYLTRTTLDTIFDDVSIHPSSDHRDFPYSHPEPPFSSLIFLPYLFVIGIPFIRLSGLKAICPSGIGEADVVITNKTPVTREVFDACPGIRMVSVLATGYDVIDCACAKERGICVSNVPSYGSASVSQFSIALLFRDGFFVYHARVFLRQITVERDDVRFRQQGVHVHITADFFSGIVGVDIVRQNIHS